MLDYREEIENLRNAIYDLERKRRNLLEILNNASNSTSKYTIEGWKNELENIDIAINEYKRELNRLQNGW